MKIFLKTLLGLSILGAGIMLFTFLSSYQKEPEKKPQENFAVVVEVETVLQVDKPITVNTMGTVMPARSVTLSPEVGGKVVSQSPNLVPGGYFKKGQTILRIDPRDYDLALQQQEANVRRAQMELATEKARGEVAAKEWELIKDQVTPTEEGRKLALREIQLETAQAALQSAKSGLDKAKLSRARTIVKAPFNAVVTEEFVDKGQIVAPGTRIATLVDGDVYWVRASAPVDRLPWISVPDPRNPEGGSHAKVIHKIAEGVEVERAGRVIRLLGDLDARGKMARVLVEVSDPHDEEEASPIPLLIGAYVKVEIAGPMVEGVIQIPRKAMRDRSTVWLKRGREMKIVEVETVWSDEKNVYIRGDVADGDEVIVSHIAAPVDGMAVRLEGETADAGAPAESPLPAEVAPAEVAQ